MHADTEMELLKVFVELQKCEKKVQEPQELLCKRILFISSWMSLMLSVSH